MRKYKKYAGADQHTPGVPQYFSWINNTNEGSTEAQTLTNLAFFGWMRDTYGMQLRIYAWDAGNFDGAGEGYGNLNGEKFRSQYPNGYAPIVEKAAEIGARLGLWGSPDGYGDDPETEKTRYDFFVHLCRDYHFALFKLDGVCGRLRPEKAALFARMLTDCRKYSPDLIVLNHRLDLYEAEKHVTTFLWNGDETYTDVFSHNRVTAPHPRAYLFSRGHVDKLNRLAEDHGVCLSSSLDRFEDDLIYQAFSRSLILSPEIYGNPWFLKDGELPRLARVYTLQAANAAILPNGMRLPERFGPNAVSRGDGGKRMLCTGNDTWEEKTLALTLDESVGLIPAERIRVILRHPWEEYIGDFAYGETVALPLPPFRAVLAELSVPDRADPVLTNCRYHFLTPDETGAPKTVRILETAGGKIELLRGNSKTPFGASEKTDLLQRAPKRLGEADRLIRSPANGEQLYEAAVFAADNDALEARCRKRAGETAHPEVKAARDAFFAQKTYRLRGCEAANLFDGRDDTFFDAQSRSYCGGFRIDGGCLRIDAGETLDADTVEIVCFAPDSPTREAPNQIIPAAAECSADLARWSVCPLEGVSQLRKTEQEVVLFGIHSTYMTPGRMLSVTYQLDGPFRFLRVADPMDRIFHVRFYKDGKAVTPAAPRANNLMAHPAKRPVRAVKSGSFTLPEFRPGSYLASAINGYHYAEQVYACLETEGALSGFPRRAPDYRANVWEHIVCSEDQNNTFYYPLTPDMAGKTVTAHAVFCSGEAAECRCELWLCDRPE